MRTLILSAVAVSLIAGQALANGSTDTMKACAAAWKALSVDEKSKTTYHNYSTTCLKNHGPTTAVAPETPQDRMKACAAKWDAAKKDGTTGGQTYRQFSAKCLKGA